MRTEEAADFLRASGSTICATPEPRWRPRRNYEGGVTASFTATAFTGYQFRKTKLFGTHGCIEGDGKVLDLLDFRTRRREWVPIPTVDAPRGLEGHGGGDAGLIRAFWMPWSPVIRPLTFRIRVKPWLRTTSPGPPES